MKTKHHYVPQFYLRSFAADDRRRQIHVFNLSRRKAFQSVGLKDQCFRNRFYGETDVIENALAELESNLAPVLRQVVISSRLPLDDNESQIKIIMFVTYQLMRTARQAENNNLRFGGMMKKLLSHDQRFKGTNWDEAKIGLNAPVMMGLALAPDMVPYYLDLDLFLICASTKSHFITSDDPVFKYNLYNEGIKGLSVTGARSTGLLIFVPLSPNHILLLCDREIYRLRHDGHHIVTASEDDVSILNGMQVANADANLYFQDWSALSVVQKVERQHRALRAVETVWVEEHEEVEPESDSLRRSLIHTYDRMPDLKLQLSFLKESKKSKQIPRKQRLHVQNRYRKTSINPLNPFDEIVREAPRPPFGTQRKIYRRTVRD